MSIFPKQFISSVAETIGISNGVNDQVQSLLIEDGGLFLNMKIIDNEN
jgi:hypothetical protein